MINDLKVYLSKKDDPYTWDKNTLKIFQGEVELERTEPALDKIYSPKYFGFRIVLTEKCNYGCRHCFVKDTPYESLKDISEKDLFAVLDFAGTHAVDQQIKIQFFGGEPLIKFNLIKLAVSYMQKKVELGEILQPEYAITVNGSMVTPEIAKFFKEHSFGVGVSLDGPEEINDELRTLLNGKGTYGLTIKGINVLRENNVPFWILITPLKRNYKDVPSFIRFFKKEFDISTITINTPIDGEMSLLLDGEEFAEMIMQSILVGKEIGVEVESCASAILYCISHKILRQSQCSIGDSKIMVSVSPQANISYCAQTWSPVLSPRSVHNFEPFSFPLTFDDSCKTCEAQFVCGGPCMAHLQFKGVKDVELCRFYKHFINLFFKHIDSFMD